MSIDRSKQGKEAGPALSGSRAADTASVAPAGDENLQTLRQAQSDISDSLLLSANTAPAELAGYRIIPPCLGSGAYGEVWKAFAARTGKEVAVKFFTRKSGLDWLFLQREVERLAKLDRHRGVIKLLDVDLAHDPPFYVMELLAGGTLEPYTQPNNLPTPAQTIEWAEQICEALAYVHGKGLIHCDLKPANILLDEQGHPRLFDFGQSRVLTESSGALGTLYYMAPEQAVPQDERAQPDVRWDVYAVGAIMHVLLTGSPPHQSPEMDQVLMERRDNLAGRLDAYRKAVRSNPLKLLQSADAKRIGPELAAVVADALAPDPDRRYRNVTELQADLAALKANRPVSPLADRRGYRARKFIQRNPLALGLVAAGLALVVTLGVIRQQGVRSDERQARALLADFVSQPAQALANLSGSSARVRGFAARQAAERLASSAYTDRIMGARSAPWLDPNAFWKAIADGGELWNDGQWLELCLVDWPASQREQLLRSAADRARSGNDREKYAAFCLIGELGGDRSNAEAVPAALRDELHQVCAQTAGGEQAAGVVAAAAWAAARLGAAVPARTVTDKHIWADDLTHLTFVRLPASDAFKSGADPSDEYRMAGLEDRAGTPLKMPALYVSSTEVTVAALTGLSEAPPQATDKPTAAAGTFSVQQAERYCDWLNKSEKNASPQRRYRLPTVEEWEYAARGGNAGRFCYGNDPRYAKLFARCDGEVVPFHEVAERMPNWYGLFDMHGGLWELTATVCAMEQLPAYIRESLPPNPDNEMRYFFCGGAYSSPPVRCRSTQRNIIRRSGADAYTGLRLVMEVGE